MQEEIFQVKFSHFKILTHRINLNYQFKLIYGTPKTCHWLQVGNVIPGIFF